MGSTDINVDPLENLETYIYIYNVNINNNI